jgi:hypothetical protein
MDSFNPEATAGPYLRAHAVHLKEGTKATLEEATFELMSSVARGEQHADQLPPFGARLGFRSKLRTEEEAEGRLKGRASAGACRSDVGYAGATMSSPAASSIAEALAHRYGDPASSHKNKIVGASSQWRMLGRVMSRAKTVVELDWGQFDEDRHDDDLEFLAEVLHSCFAPQNLEEEGMVGAMRQVYHNTVVNKLVFYSWTTERFTGIAAVFLPGRYGPRQSAHA